MPSIVPITLDFQPLRGNDDLRLIEARSLRGCHVVIAPPRSVQSFAEGTLVDVVDTEKGPCAHIHFGPPLGNLYLLLRWLVLPHDGAEAVMKMTFPASTFPDIAPAGAESTRVIVLVVPIKSPGTLEGSSAATNLWTSTIPYGDE